MAVRSCDTFKVFKFWKKRQKMLFSWLVVLAFNATLTAVISWRSVTHMCFLAFSHQCYQNFLFPKQPTTSLTCFCRGEKRKCYGKKVRLNQESNSQPPGHESDTLTTKTPGRGGCSYDCLVNSDPGISLALTLFSKTFSHRMFNHFPNDKF